MGEQAGQWVAVSTNKQDEKSQEPDIAAWMEDHDYEMVKTYRLHGVSRYSGKKKHDDMLDLVIADMTSGKISVLVVWQSSRIERRGVSSVFDLARRVKEAGGRIEYVQDSYLNDTNEMSDVVLALVATKDKGESRDKSKRISNRLKIRRGEGLWLGGTPPFGYRAYCTCHETLTCPYRATVDKKPEGWKLEYHPERKAILDGIVKNVLDGRSTLSIVRELNENGITTVRGGQWSVTNTLKMLRSPALLGYRTHQPNWREASKNKGQRGEIKIERDEKGMPVKQYPELLNQETFDKLQKQLERNSVKKTQEKAGRGKFGMTSNRYDAALLTSIIKCFCGAHMNQAKNPTRTYRCLGGQNAGQGVSHGRVSMEELDTFIDTWMITHTYPIYDYNLTGGENAEKLARIQSEIQTLASSGMFTAEISHQISALNGQALELSKLKPEPRRMVPVATGKTLADVWPDYSLAQKHKFLIDNGFQVIAARKRRLFGGVLAPDDSWTNLDKFGRVLCDGCGKLATEKFGTCATHSTNETKAGKSCWNLMRRRRYLSKTEPVHTLDIDEVIILVIPGLRYEAEYMGLHDLYEKDPEAARRKVDMLSVEHRPGRKRLDWRFARADGKIVYSDFDPVTGKFNIERVDFLSSP